MSAVLGPLVGPGAELTAEERRRYSRHLLLPELGETGQRRLKAARVLVVGAGGLGSPVLQYLAAAGVGVLGVVDDDVVDESNLQRQVVHRSEDVGRAKVASARDAVTRANPLVRVEPHPVRLSADNAVDLVARYDLVVDGSDNFATRYLVDDACTLTGTPWVWGAVLRFDGHVATFWDGHGPTYRDLFPEPPAPGTVPSCSEAGVLGAVCGTVGSVMAAEAVKLVTGTGTSLLGRLLVLDGSSWTWRTLAVRPDPRRAAPGLLTDEPQPPDEDAVTAAELRVLRAADPDLLVVDVREPVEHAGGAVPGAVLVPLGDLASADLPRDRDVVLHCASGTRSALGLDVLRGRGYDRVRHLAGGYVAWRKDPG